MLLFISSRKQIAVVFSIIKRFCHFKINQLVRIKSTATPWYKVNKCNCNNIVVSFIVPPEKKNKSNKYSNTDEHGHSILFIEHIPQSQHSDVRFWTVNSSTSVFSSVLSVSSEDFHHNLHPTKAIPLPQFFATDFAQYPL